jgi:hypothetical protein
MISVNLQTEIALLRVTKLCGTEYCMLSIICRQNTVFSFLLFHSFLYLFLPLKDKGVLPTFFSFVVPG